MSRYRISHRTAYSYGAPVIQSNHLLHLSPRVVDNQRIVSHTLDIEPALASRRDRTDFFGNPTTLISLEQEHTELSVQSSSEIDVTGVAQPAFEATTPWQGFPSGRQALPAEIIQFTCPSRYASASALLYEFARPSFPDGMPMLEGTRQLMQRIFEEFQFDNTTTDVSTPVEQVLQQRSGVCQDFAHLQIAALRSMGLPARYVSGYILTHPPEGEVKLEGSDASHAWLSVWAPETGWVDFDPTNNLVNSPEHIAISYGRDFEDVSPISGVLLGGGKHTVSVAVDVRPLD